MFLKILICPRIKGRQQAHRPLGNRADQARKSNVVSPVSAFSLSALLHSSLPDAVLLSIFFTQQVI